MLYQESQQYLIVRISSVSSVPCNATRFECLSFWDRMRDRWPQCQYPVVFEKRFVLSKLTPSLWIEIVLRVLIPKETRIWDPMLKKAIDSGWPSLISMYGGWHYAAVYGYSKTHLFVMNPSLNPDSMGSVWCALKKSKFRQIGVNWALVVRPQWKSVGAETRGRLFSGERWTVSTKSLFLSSCSSPNPSRSFAKRWNLSIYKYH